MLGAPIVILCSLFIVSKIICVNLLHLLFYYVLQYADPKSTNSAQVWDNISNSATRVTRAPSETVLSERRLF